MKKSIEKVMAVTLAAAMAFSLSACGKSENNPTEKQEQRSEVQETESTADNAPVTIKITWWGGQSRHETTQKVLDLYTELHPNVKFEAIPSGWDGYFDKLATNAASGSMPDIVQMDYLYISTYTQNNSLADLKPYIDDGTIDVSNIEPVLYNSGMIDGKLTGMIATSGMLAVPYNPSVMEEAGLSNPEADWTWDDMITMCKTVKEKTGKLGFASLLADDTNNFNYFVRQNQAQLFSDDKRSIGYEDDKIYVDFVNIMSDMVQSGAMPNPDEYAAITAKGDEASPLVTGEGAMTFSWSNYATRVENYNDTIELITPPYGSERTEGLWIKPGQFFSIAQTSKVKKEAAEFINWFLNSEEANLILGVERGIPVSSTIRETLMEKGGLTETQIKMFDYTDFALEHCGPIQAPDPAGISEVNEEFKATVYSVLYGQVTAEEAAATFRKKANEILERNN